ncbi:MAG: hypothetical protein WD208_09420 [Dehalococcoidia bacterium]
MRRRDLQVVTATDQLVTHSIAESAVQYRFVTTARYEKWREYLAVLPPGGSYSSSNSNMSALVAPGD